MPEALSENEKRILLDKGVDVDLSLSILKGFNDGVLGKNPPVVPEDVPEIDGIRITDLRNPESFHFTKQELEDFATSFPEAYKQLSPENEDVSPDNLQKAGLMLLPYFAYGFLNGGSATSYGDVKKNRGFDGELYKLYEQDFTRLADGARGRPKGVTPGFLQPDGEAGPSYMELKLRSLLMLTDAYAQLSGKKPERGIPFFQMTSVSNDEEVREALEQYSDSPWLNGLAEKLQLSPWEGQTAVQPLVTAYTHSEEGTEKGIFKNESRDFPFVVLPGGHGQCFRVLKETWKSLYAQGIRFISLGNIDNLGYTLDPVELALLAIRKRPAGFDESFKTAVDIKGGILIEEKGGRLNCVDLGVGISHEDAAELEESGKKILFNCGSGLFDLSWLLENIDRIIDELPLRFSDQNKDAGRYSQAEQVTWEVMGMIENPLIFAVDKYDRFLAAKILMENMMTSGLKLDDPGFPVDGGIRETAGRLHEGLKALLVSKYGLEIKDGRWTPVEK